MKVLRKSGWIFDRIVDLLIHLAFGLLIFSWLSVCTSVPLRYFLHNPMRWTNEVTGYILLWITFLGTAWLLRREGHVKLDIVLNRLNPRTQALLNVITSAIGVVVCLYVAWYGAEATWDCWQSSITVATFLTPPKAPILSVIPVGSILLSIQFIRRAYGYLKSWKLLQDKEQRS